jgi:hypothetical protein
MEIVDYLEDEWQLWPEHLTKFERAYAPVTDAPVNRFNEAFIKPASRLRRTF